MSNTKVKQEGWREVKLGEVISRVIDNRGKTPPTQEFGYELLEINAITSESRLPQYSKVRKYVSEDIYNNWFRSGHPQVNDILVPTVGTIGNVAILKATRGSIAQNLIALRINKENISDYIYYYLNSTIGKKNVYNLDIGGVQPSVKVPHLLNVKIPIPPLPGQKAIAEILSSLDDKIDLLRRQNKTLEDMAQTLFRHWFVENASEEWEVKKLGDTLTIKGGTTPSTKESKYWNGSINWTTPKDLSNHNSVFLFDTERKITPQGLEKISSGLLPVGTVLLSSRAPIGYLAISNLPLSINQGYIAILCDNILSNYFVYLWCSNNIEMIKNSGNGSVFQEISKSVFRGIDIRIPPQEKLQDFDKIIQPVFQKIKINQFQIQTLQKLRDTLLPKLMRGQVRAIY